MVLKKNFKILCLIGYQETHIHFFFAMKTLLIKQPY